MVEDRFARLTDGEKRCLRAVLETDNSQQIHQIVGLAPGTVDQYLSRAQAKLGVNGRRAAARQLRDFENGLFKDIELRKPLVPSEIFGVETTAPRHQEADAGRSVQEVRMPFELTPSGLDVRPPVDPQGRGRARNELNLKWRLAYLLALPFVLMGTFAIFAQGLGIFFSLLGAAIKRVLHLWT